MAAESVRTGACVTSGAEKLAARAGKGGGRTGVKRRRYALLVTRMASFCMRDCRVDRFRPRRAAAPSGPATTQLFFLESSQDLLALRLFQRFANVAFRDCRNQADEDGKAGEPLASAGYATATSSFRPGGNNKRKLSRRPVGPLPIGWVSSSGANCRKSSMRRSLSGSSGSIGACRR